VKHENQLLLQTHQRPQLDKNVDGIRTGNIQSHGAISATYARLSDCPYIGDLISLD
jgi:hypothetical protein